MMADPNPDTPKPGAGLFAETHWSVVLAAGRGDDTRAQAALAQLCQIYWYPLYALVRHQGYSAEDAQDLTQGFFAHLLEHKGLAGVHPDKGKFRSFLRVSLRNFLASEWAYKQAQKRGGGHLPVSLDVACAETRFGAEASVPESPDVLYERNWALALLEQVLKRLRAEQAAKGKETQFEVLQDCLMGEPDRRGYAQIGVQLGISENAVKMAVHRLRTRCRELLHEEIAHTVNSPSEVEEEIRYLFAVLGG